MASIQTSSGTVTARNPEEAAQFFDAKLITQAQFEELLQAMIGQIPDELDEGGSGTPQDQPLTREQIIAAFLAREIDAEDALRLFADIGVSGTDAEAALEGTGLIVFPDDQVRPPADPPFVPPEEAGEFAGLETSPALSTREALLEGQPAQDVFRRFLEESVGFGGLSGPARRAFTGGDIFNRAQDLFSQNIISQFGAPSPGAEVPSGRFGDFLGGARPSAAGLSQGLRNITSTLGRGGDTPFTSALRGAFSEPGDVFGAAIQPSLRRIDPLLRGAFFGGASNLFNRLRTTQPQLFETPESGFRQFATRGFF